MRTPTTTSMQRALREKWGTVAEQEAQVEAWCARRRIVEAAKRIAQVQWRRAGGGGWERVKLHRQIANKHYIRNEERLSFREFVEAKNPFDTFLRNYRRHFARKRDDFVGPHNDPRTRSYLSLIKGARVRHAHCLKRSRICAMGLGPDLLA
jgi:hypothetical protein